MAVSFRRVFLRLFRMLFGLVCVFALSTQWGCGPNLQPGAPIIRDFSFVGQETDRPQNFRFRIQWQDFEGDLGIAPSSAPTSGERKSILVIEIKDPTGVQKSSLIVEFPLRTEASRFGSFLLIPEGTKEGLFKELGIILASDETYPSQLQFTLTMWDSLGKKSNQPSVTIATTN